MDVTETEHEKIMDYNGKYIVFSDWFNMDNYPDIKQKIEQEYEKIENSGIYIYSPNWNVFSMEKAPNADSMHQYSNTYLLIRKANH